MSGLPCPHCDAFVQSRDTFCTECGKAVGTSSFSGPTLTDDKSLGRSSVGKELQSDAMLKKAKSASGALLAVAILQLVALAVLAGLLPAGPDKNLVLVVVGAISAVYWGLWWWSRSSPFPAALTGLIVYLTMLGVGAALDPSTLFQGILIKVIIVVVLVRAVQAGLQHKRLVESM
ncbi:MAG: zinc ribbon domain-containing protein [Planctomycetota bacterium]